MAKPKPIKIPRIVQLPSGSWFCRVRVNGEDIPITDEDYNVVEAKAYAYKAGLLQAKKKPLENTTVGQAFDKYIETEDLSPTTADRYRRIRQNYMAPLMGLKLADITMQKINKSMEQERRRISRNGKPLSPKTIKNAYSLLKSVLNKYYPDFKCEINYPEIKRKVPFILHPAEIYPAVKGTDIELAVLLAMWYTMSMSEIRGLTKSRSLYGNKLVIRETVVTVTGDYSLRKTGGKEVERTRAFDLDDYVVSLIDKVEGDIIVPYTSNRIYRKFQACLKKAGLPPVSFHSLRHVAASVMADLGIPDPIQKERGGWLTDNILKNTYTHTFSRSRIEADRTIDTYFTAIIQEAK